MLLTYSKLKGEIVKVPKCRKYRCDENAVSAGYCQKHSDEVNAKLELEKKAVDILRSGIYPSQLNSDLKTDFEKVLPWWNKACQIAWSQEFYNEEWLREKDLVTELCISFVEAIIEFRDTHIFATKKEHFWYNVKRLDMDWNVH